MKEILLVLQIVISSALIVLILLQAKGTGLGTAFGGSAQVYRSRKGVEKLFLYFTIILILLFFTTSVLLALTN